MLNVLVTGAAGLLGGEVCARLLSAGHGVTGLVHRNPDVRANSGAAVSIPTLSGDVAQPRFGWDEAQWRAVAAEHDLIVHCAATVRFDLAEEDYRAVNVDGVRHALDLAEAGEMQFLHVSTAYVCGARNGVVSENDPLPETGFANGYEASKAAGERLVRVSDLDWTIARPSIVVGEYESGAIRQFDTTYAAFKLIAEGRVRSMPARPGATLDFVPLDYVAKGIAALADSMDARGKTVHLISAQPLPVGDFAGAIGAYPHFHEPDLVPPDRFDPAALAPLERRLYTRIAGLYASYFARNPQFGDGNAQTLLGLQCPPTGPAYIGRLIDYCIETGFLPAFSARPDSAAPSSREGRRPTASRL